jgi:chitinase
VTPGLISKNLSLETRQMSVATTFKAVLGSSMSSVVSLVENYGLDGVDIGWEYLADASQAANLVSLLQAVRDTLDIYRSSLSTLYPFILTATCPRPYGYGYLNLSRMDPYLDFWNLMAYDYTGPWSNVSGDQANLFHSSSYPESTPFDTEAIISYISQNISFDKIVLGIPLYGRAFNDTDGLGDPFSGSRTYDFKDLPLSGTTKACDNTTGSCYSYRNRELISYNLINPVVYLKADFIQNKTLGGAMF